MSCQAIKGRHMVVASPHSPLENRIPCLDVEIHQGQNAGPRTKRASVSSAGRMSAVSSSFWVTLHRLRCALRTSICGVTGRISSFQRPARHRQPQCNGTAEARRVLRRLKRVEAGQESGCAPREGGRKSEMPGVLGCKTNHG